MAWKDDPNTRGYCVFWLALGAGIVVGIFGANVAALLFVRWLASGVK